MPSGEISLTAKQRDAIKWYISTVIGRTPTPEEGSDYLTAICERALTTFINHCVELHDTHRSQAHEERPQDPHPAV